MSVYDEFKKLMNKERTDISLLVPLFIWTSGTIGNIESMQKINKSFFFVDKKILNNSLNLNANVKFMCKYPKLDKDEEIAIKFLKDTANYYGWTTRELDKNMSILNVDELKTFIANAYGYEKKERKALEKVTL